MLSEIEHEFAEKWIDKHNINDVITPEMVDECYNEFISLKHEYESVSRNDIRWALIDIMDNKQNLRESDFCRKTFQIRSDENLFSEFYNKGIYKLNFNILTDDEKNVILSIFEFTTNNAKLCYRVEDIDLIDLCPEEEYSLGLVIDLFNHTEELYFRLTKNTQTDDLWTCECVDINIHQR